jgi:hypothetical protein
MTVIGAIPEENFSDSILKDIADLIDQVLIEKYPQYLHPKYLLPT